MSRLKIPRVVKMPIEVQATDALRDSIVSGAIPPGERITELQISDQMSLSRATVRTALHQLAKEGLLTLVPYTGWTVVSLSAQDVWELYTLRSAVERLAAQLVASTMTPKKAARLDEAFERLVEECKRGDAGRIAEADFGLHKSIIVLAEHGRLAMQYGLIEQQTRMYIRSSDALVPGARKIIDQHRPIVNAIRAGDAEEGGRLSEEHNLTEGEKLSRHLKGLEMREAAVAATARPVRKRIRR
ncbi:GntR family transcriptional regulator [Tardiphaga sp.]|uniref:GntR family transcriptional regulator n=1 Tax=Tardiphaga sp. TaxID=1926292 RepID=UPI0037DA0D35